MSPERNWPSSVSPYILYGDTPDPSFCQAETAIGLQGQKSPLVSPETLFGPPPTSQMGEKRRPII